MFISQCPICVVEKYVELHVPIRPPEIRGSGFAHFTAAERMPLAAWMSLTAPRGMVMRCYCPQCGILFHHPELVDLAGAPPAPVVG